MKKIVLLFVTTLSLIMTSLSVSAQNIIDSEAVVQFLGIAETDGMTFDFSTLAFGQASPIELEPGQKYVLVVLLDDAVGENFSASSIEKPSLRLSHPEYIDANEEAKFETLLTGIKDGESMFVSDQVSFTVSEAVIIQPYQYADGHVAFSNNVQGESTDLGDVVMTLDNISNHIIDLKGDEELVGFLIEVLPQVEAANEETPLITVEESDQRPITPYNATSVISVFASIVLITVLIVIYRRYYRQRKK